MTTPAGLPSYDHPPVIEVVCGLQFKPLNILMAHLGLLFQRYQPDYTQVAEAAPLAPVIEQFIDPPGSSVSLADLPRVPRTWFIHRDETGIVQVQRDRFLHNWKKVRPADDYPRYERVIGLFRNRLQTFTDFLREMDLGDPQPVQYEMTYVNHVVQGEGWTSTDDVGDVFPDFAKQRQPDRFLPPIELCNWRTTFGLPEKQGRLHATIRTATRSTDQKLVFVFELTARGFPPVGTEAAMWQWFDLAHEWIVRGFTDMTSGRMQRDQWQRIR